jgi:hypothetical protein
MADEFDPDLRQSSPTSSSTKVSVGYMHSFAGPRKTSGGGSDTFYEEAVVYHDMALRQVVEETFDEDNLHSTLVCSCTS